ncbi:long-chain fatty acid--CoA ligase [Saccharothrix violaceirubra]|uniref:Long-chain acyl-CoA synthetase n=1 Tax=Saccharothrix violaceirubra TaxID=413306 RepID=A0A7W7WT70_9PSEU|nr:AMP-binding protein [Saccharothrix violaceirubra]MBB4962764.1 long-chain acyl-CoA synthetase [Saccharothrix violaceirubra]
MTTPARNVADLVRGAAHRGPKHVALVDVTSGLSLTWSEIDALADAEAHRLVAAGVEPGDRVLVRLPTGPAFAVAVFGALRAGAVLVPVGPNHPEAETRRALADSGARLVVDAGHPPADAPGEPFETRGGGEDLAVLAYTSGTSGVPRGAMLTHRALLANITQCATLRPAPVTAGDRVLLALPLFHVYGLGPGLFQVAGAGATAVLLERFDADSALTAIAEHRVTTVVGVPPMYQAILAEPVERLRTDLATVRLFTSGAAPLSPGLLVELWQAVGLPVFEGYGLTETGPVLTTTLGGAPKPGSVGRPLPGVDVRLVDSDGRPIGEDDENGTGLVAARGDNLFSGYWPDGVDGPDADGWFRTGDVGYLDGEGDLHLVDRAGDLIIVNGFNVYPHEVERVLCQLDGVVEAAAVGVRDERTGETVKAVLVPAEGVTLTEDAVKEHCATRLAKFKVPTVVEFATALPHSPTGKLARSRLRLPLG